MKLIPMLLINLACVGVGIGVYDMVKSDGSAAEGRTPELLTGSDLEERVAKLEAAGPRGPLLSGPEAPRLTEAQVMDLIEKHMPERAGAPAGDGATAAVITEAIAVAADPDETQVAAFRQMLEKVEAVRRQEREVERTKAREARARARLDRLDMGLTDDQKSEILSMAKAHGEKLRSTVRKLRESGAEREEWREVMRATRDDLVKSVETIVSTEEDAQKVVRAVTSGGMRRGFGGADGGGGGGRAGRR